MTKSQPLPFTKIFGNANIPEQGSGVVQLPSGSIFYAGSAQSDSIGGYDILITKLSPEGNILWQKSFGTPDDDYANGLLLYDSQTMVISGSRILSGNFHKEAFLLKLDTLGNELWTRTFEDSLNNAAFKTVEKAADGGLLVCGSISAANGIGNDSYIVKTDAMGMEEWTSPFLDSLIDIAHAGRNTDDGGFIIAGDQQHPDGHYNIYALRIDSLGQVVWHKRYDSPLNGGAQNLIATTDGNYLISGESFPDTAEPYFDFHLIKITPDGDTLWTKYIGDPFGEAAFKVIEERPGVYTMAGYGYNFANISTDIFVVETDSLGNETNRRHYGTPSIDQGFDLAPSIYGGFLAAGFANVNGDDQFILVYDQFLPANTGGISPDRILPLTIYPNPAKPGEEVRIEGIFGRPVLTITDLQGRKVLTRILSVDDMTFKIPDSMASGVYLLNLTDREKFYYSKLRLEP